MMKVVDVDRPTTPENDVANIELVEQATKPSSSPSPTTETTETDAEIRRPAVLPKSTPEKLPVLTGRSSLLAPHETKHSKEALHANSLHIINLRKQNLQQKKLELEKELLQHSNKPWKRKFYCSDMCRIKTILFVSDSSYSSGASLYSYFLIATILLSYTMAITETFRDTDMETAPYMRGNLQPNKYLHVQAAFVIFFALDTFTRFILTDSWFLPSKITEAQRSLDPHKSLSHKPFFLDYWNWVDIISVVFVFFVGFSASFVIVLRIFRPIRHLNTFKIIVGTMKESSGLLTVSTFFLFSVIVVFAFLVLAFESCYHNDCQFVDAFSSLYFIVITMTSVGFGDQIPTSAMARGVALLAMIIGSFYLAMPLAIVGSQFDRAWEEQEEAEKKKRTPAENKILESIHEKRLTLLQRRQRVVILSYQSLDMVHSVMGHIRLFSYQNRGSKQKVSVALETLFSYCGQMLDELLILFPTYPIENIPKYEMKNPFSSRGRSTKLKSLSTLEELRDDSKRSHSHSLTGDLREEATAAIAVAAVVDLEKGEAKHEEDETKKDEERSVQRKKDTFVKSKKDLTRSATSAVDTVHRGRNDSGVSSDSNDSNDSKNSEHSKVRFQQRRGSSSLNPSSLKTTSLEVPRKHGNGPVLWHAAKVLQSSRDVEIAKMNAAMRGVSFLKRKISAETGLTHVVPLTGVHTPDGIPLVGHYWAGQTSKHARDMTVKELLNKYRIERSKRIGHPTQCDQSIRKCVSCFFNSVNVNTETVVYKANGGCSKSKIWLILEAPESSKLAYWTRNIRLAFTFFALLLVFVETTPEFNRYGVETRSCKASVNYYCNWISSCVGTTDISGDQICQNLWSKREAFTQEEVNAFNPGCFPNATSGYKGCIGEMDGEYSQCDFPNEKLGITMKQKNLFGEDFLKYLGKSDTSKKVIKDRMQCQNENGYGQDWCNTFWSFELVFTIIFFLELVVRLAVATIPDDLTWTDWFSDFGNWIDILAVSTALLEFIGNTYDFGSNKYTVWGWMWFHTNDPMTFRFLRIVVAIRFMLQQRHFKNTKIITSTISQVLSRLMVPLLLFGLLVTMFGSLLYFMEGGVLYDCADFNAPTKQTCHYCGGPPFVVPFGTGVTDYFVNRNKEHGGFDANGTFSGQNYAVMWSDPWLGHEEWYNGTCRFLHEAAGGAVSGVGAGSVMQTPLIIDAADGVWTIFVVMTTVGFGGKRPHTSAGKSIVVVAAIFGAFYLAMPLSIIATAFNKNYQIHVEKESKDEAIRQRHKLTFGGGKLKFMHIVKLKLWAKRAVARAQGHHHILEPPGEQVTKYAKALHNLANRHNYTDLQEFKIIHKSLLENCITIVARHMHPAKI